MQFLVKFDLEIDLKFEISDGKNLVKFGGRTFLLPREHGKFRREFRGKFRSKFRGYIRKLRFNFFSETSFSRREVLIFSYFLENVSSATTTTESLIW